MRIDGSIDGEHNDSVEGGGRAIYWAWRATCGGRGDVRKARRHCHAASTRRRRCARLSWATCSGVGCAILLRLVDVWRCHTRRLMPDVKRYATRRAAVLFRTYSFASDRLECWPERDVARRHGTGAVRPATNAVKPRTMDAPRVRPQQAAARLEVRQAYAKTEARLCCRLVDNWSFKFLSSTKTGHVAMLCRGSRPVESRRTRPDAATEGREEWRYDTRASGYPGSSVRKNWRPGSCALRCSSSRFVRSTGVAGASISPDAEAFEQGLPPLELTDHMSLCERRVLERSPRHRRQLLCKRAQFLADGAKVSEAGA